MFDLNLTKEDVLKQDEEIYLTKGNAMNEYIYDEKKIPAFSAGTNEEFYLIKENEMNIHSLKTSQSLTEMFLNCYQYLSYLEQKIFYYLQIFSQHHRCVFPSQSHIAVKCGCSRRTVIRVLKKFNELGWIVKVRRCYRSCKYYVNENLKNLELKNPLTFMLKKNYKNEKSGTRDVTIYSVHSTECNTRDTLDQGSRYKYIYSDIERFRKYLSNQDVEKFKNLMDSNPVVMRMALNDAVQYAKKTTIENYGRYIQSRINEYTKAQNNIAEEVKYIQGINEEELIRLTIQKNNHPEEFRCALERLKEVKNKSNIKTVFGFLVKTTMNYIEGKFKKKPVENKNFEVRLDAKGNVSSVNVSAEENKIWFKSLEEKIECRNGLIFEGYSKHVEIGRDQIFCYDYEDDDFKQNVMDKCLQYGIDLREIGNTV